MNKKFWLALCMISVLLPANHLVFGEEDFINLGRLSIARVSASSVNGHRSLSDEFYGVRNLFDLGEHVISNPTPINYDYWMSDVGSSPWVKVRFLKPVEVEKIILEIPGIWETQSTTKDNPPLEEGKPVHIASTKITVYETVRSSSVPAEFAVEIGYEKNGTMHDETLDSIPIKGSITTYPLPKPISDVNFVKIVFPTNSSILVNELKIMGRAPQGTDLTAGVPSVDMNQEEAVRFGREIADEYIKLKYSEGKVIEEKGGWDYEVVQHGNTILRINFNNEGEPQSLYDGDLEKIIDLTGPDLDKALQEGWKKEETIPVK